MHCIFIDNIIKDFVHFSGPPQISNVAAQDLDLAKITHGGLEIGVRSHTPNVDKCELKQYSMKQGVKGMICKTSGNPPNLTVTLFFDTQSIIEEGNWTLFLHNDVGMSNKTFTFRKTVREYLYIE